MAGAARAQIGTGMPGIERFDPPYFGFYTKAIDCDGVFIRGSALVEDRALVDGCMRMQTMLASMDVAKQNLRQRGVELHLLGKGQGLLELPENHGRHPINDGGATTQKSNPDGGRAESGIYSACGEESLLSAASHRGDDTTDLCMREFAIALMNYGLDEEIRKLIEAQFGLSVNAGRWRGSRAARSPEDYWAELSMWYFGPDTAEAQSKRKEDIAGFALLDLLYQQRKRPIAIEAIRARSVSKLALSRVSSRQAELQLINNSDQRIRVFWMDPDGAFHPMGELGPYNRIIEKTFFQHVWMIEDERGVELQRFVVEDYVSEVIAEY